MTDDGYIEITPGEWAPADEVLGDDGELDDGKVWGYYHPETAMTKPERAERLTELDWLERGERAAAEMHGLMFALGQLSRLSQFDTQAQAVAACHKYATDLAEADEEETIVLAWRIAEHALRMAPSAGFGHAFDEGPEECYATDARHLRCAVELAQDDAQKFAAGDATFAETVEAGPAAQA